MAPQQVIQRIVVIGGGFAGLAAARALAGARVRQDDVSGAVVAKEAPPVSYDITVIDRRNHHLFQPLLYQVATAALSPADIAFPIRSLFADNPNVRVILDEVIGFGISKAEGVDSYVFTRSGRYPFDALIVAAGAGHSYFGHDEWEPFAPGLKTLEQATDIRRRILLAFEQAEMESDPQKQKALLTFVVVGGGPTGVEIAGAIAEISRYTLEKDFRRIDPSRTRVILVEAGGRLLATFPEKLAKQAARDLENMGVQLWTSTRVSKVEADGVHLGVGMAQKEFIQAQTVIWAAGVKPSPVGAMLVEALGGDPSTMLDSQGRVRVDSTLQVTLPEQSLPPIFVVGDMASAEWSNGPKNSKTLPGLAPVAMQAGHYAADAIVKLTKREALQPFLYNDKGQMATIGRRRAIVDARGIRFSGYFAWMTWLFVHIYYLIGFKNRLFVFMSWAWSYVTFRRGARLILDKPSI